MNKADLQFKKSMLSVMAKAVSHLSSKSKSVRSSALLSCQMAATGLQIVENKNERH